MQQSLHSDGSLPWIHFQSAFAPLFINLRLLFCGAPDIFKFLFFSFLFFSFLKVKRFLKDFFFFFFFFFFFLISGRKSMEKMVNFWRLFWRGVKIQPLFSSLSDLSFPIIHSTLTGNDLVTRLTTQLPNLCSLKMYTLSRDARAPRGSNLGKKASPLDNNSSAVCTSSTVGSNLARAEMRENDGFEINKNKKKKKSKFKKSERRKNGRLGEHSRCCKIFN